MIFMLHKYVHLLLFHHNLTEKSWCFKTFTYKVFKIKPQLQTIIHQTFLHKCFSIPFFLYTYLLSPTGGDADQ